jgi:hypothetical protein
MNRAPVSWPAGVRATQMGDLGIEEFGCGPVFDIRDWRHLGGPESRAVTIGDGGLA